MQDHSHVVAVTATKCVSERQLWLQNQTAEGLRTAATSPTALLSGQTERSFCRRFNHLRTRWLLLHHSVTTLSAVPSFRFLRQVLVFVTLSTVLYTLLFYTLRPSFIWEILKFIVPLCDVVISHRRFRSTYLSHIQGWTIAVIFLYTSKVLV